VAKIRKKPELTALTKRALTDAFWELYCGKKIDHITVKEITDRAGFNRGTFYVYFKDVYDVLAQIENSLIPDVRLEAVDASQFADLRTVIALSVAQYEKHAKYLRVLLGPDGDPTFPVRMKAAVKPLLVHGLESTGVIVTAKVDYTIEYLFSASIGVLTYWFTRKGSIPIDELVGLLHSLFVEGAGKQIAPQLSGWSH